MDLILTRSQYRSDGIFGTLAVEKTGAWIAHTLEHSYCAIDGVSQGWIPKIPPGRYLCVRGQHHLEGHPDPIETFEITGIAGHSGLLIHPGCFNDDSHGCVLVGHEIVKKQLTQIQMLQGSQVTFSGLMRLQNSVDRFWMTMKNLPQMPAVQFEQL